ncbi:hypothetical protein Ancab_032652 [Ancistrocladus abbreviatus]
MATLKVYADRLSEPSRSVILFCKLNGIDFEEVKIDLSKLENQSPEYAKINPMKQVPAITHGDFNLFESHAILIYLACTFPDVAVHWYPTDVRKRVKLQSILDWHHFNIRRGSGLLILNLLGPFFGLPQNLEAAAQGEEIVVASLSKIDSIWLQENGKFLLGNDQLSLADISLATQVMQLQLLTEEEHNRIVGPFKKVKQWIEDVRTTTMPYFDDVHGDLFKLAAMANKQRANNSVSGS